MSRIAAPRALLATIILLSLLAPVAGAVETCRLYADRFTPSVFAGERSSLAASSGGLVPGQWPSSLGPPGQSWMGEHGYIEYIRGDLPIILVAPHGGSLAPNHLPEASSHGGDGGSLANTLLTAQFLQQRTGRYPHVVINHLRSRYLNAARDKDGAAGEHPEPRHAWEEFHHFIELAKADITEQWGRGHYYELHTNGWSQGWINIGLGINRTRLNNDDSATLLARAPYSTVRRMVEDGADFLEVLRGPSSLGGLLEEAGYHVVPSPNIPAPGDCCFFFAGWNTWAHGSRHGGTIDATHIETHFQYINAGHSKRRQYSLDLADAIITFMHSHYDDLALCP